MYHLARETIEILLNLGSKQIECKCLNEDAFLVIKNGKDVKLDLFYMCLFEYFTLKGNYLIFKLQIKILYNI